MRIVRFEQFVMLNKNAKRIAFVSGLGFAALVSSLVVPTICSANNANAEAGEPIASETSLTISSTNDQALLTVTPVSDARSFGVSDADGTAAFSVTTNNYTGYTLGIAASDDEGRLTNVDLADNSTHYLYSIASSLNASAFNNATYTNKWGFRPSKYVDNNVVVNNTGEYAVFLPAPTTTPTILDRTSVANENANDYTIALGARVDGSTYPGSYTSTMNLIALANVVNYTISFDKNTDDDVTNMPAAIGGATAETSITLPSNTPERAYHLFRGWCTVETTNTQCSGNTFQPSDEFGIDQTSANTVTFYAIWEAKPYMQDYAYEDLLELLPNVEDSTVLYDKRDDKTYTVTRIADGNIWMTENLNIAGGTELTPALSNLATNYTLPTSSDTGFDSDTGTYVYNSSNTECSESNLSVPCDSYYSYRVATAGSAPETGDAPYDICPKGWRMPTKEDYEKLMTVYPTITDLHEGAWNGQYGGVMVNNMFGHNGGLIGEFMSSTATVLSIGAPGMYYVFMNINNQTAPVWSANQRNGQFVRCISKIEYIQDYDQEELAAALPNAGDTIDLYDKRDTKKYTIGKLADGNYWFLDNLRLDLTTVDASTLKGNTNASDSTIDYLKGNTTGTANDRYATSAASYIPTGEDDDKTSYSDPYIDVTAIDDTTSAGYTIGTYYNYCAATAGSYCFGDGYNFGEPSGDAMEDICPKDWRLPTGGDSGEYASLYKAYLNNRSAFVEAAHLPLSGFNNGAPANININGGFWTSTFFGNIMNIKALYLTTSAVSQTGTDRKVGYPVRCIYKMKTYLQDLTTADYDTLIPNSGDTFVAYDKRDGEAYTIGRLNDGNVWMLQNLRLDPIAVSADKLKGNTNASDTSIDYLKGTSTGTTSDRYALAGISTNWPTDRDSYSMPYINVDYKNEAAGVLYNYCAASAGTFCYGDGTTTTVSDNPESSYGPSYGDAEEDICPKGWRLPSSGMNGETTRLLNSYSNGSALAAAFGDTGNRIILEGTTYNNSILWAYNRTNVGDNYTSAMMVFFSGGSFITAFNTGRQQGASVRCVADKKVYIQDLTRAEILALVPSEGNTVRLYDKRDDSRYTIGKLADGNVWILENLRLSIADTPLSTLQGNTNASDETLTYLKNGGGTSSDQYPISGATNWTTGRSTSDARVNISENDTILMSGYQAKLGAYYNYCAASAGSYCYSSWSESIPMKIDEDICPKGWRMPTVGTGSDYEALTTAYSNNRTTIMNALRLPYAGHFDNGSFILNGIAANQWSATSNNQLFSLPYLYINSSQLMQPGHSADLGKSVRCILDLRIYMQDYDYEDLLELLPNAEDSITLWDKRDNKTYTVTRMNDNNIWMTTNLDLDGGTELTPELSNVTSNYTLPASSNTSGFDSNTAVSVYNSNSKECSSSSPCYSYYTYAAANAGNNPSSDNSTVDICPKGWRLPSQADFEGLLDTYGEQLAASPWGEVYAGEYYGTALQQGGFHGLYWSSTANGEKAYSFYSQMYREAYASVGHNYSVSENYKRWGYQVRCISKVKFIQDYDQNELSATLPNVGDTIDLYDKRDLSKYTIGKLADGKYWFLDNLRLDLTNTATKNRLSSANTNASDAALNYLVNGGGDVNDQYAVSAVTGWSGDNYMDPKIDTSKKDEAGIFYNFCAASAGSYCYKDGTFDGATAPDALEDICPKGWRLPTGGASGELQKVYSAYGNNSSYLNALNISATGFYNTSIYNPTTINYIWSSTGKQGNLTHASKLDGSTVDPQSSYYRRYGLSVRCVFGSLFMQDATSNSLAALAPNVGDTVDLYDKRDGEKYTIGKMADGKYWFLDNLRLDPASVSLDKLKGNTNASDTTLTYLKNGGGTSSDQYPTAPVTDTWNSNSYSKPQVYTGSKNSVPETGYQGKQGVYYNYCAASAGSYCYGDGDNVVNPPADTDNINITEDICPAGWHMPTGGMPNGDYYTLFHNYYGDNEHDVSVTENYKNDLHIVYAGNYWMASGATTASVSRVGEHAYIWSSTRYAQTQEGQMFNLYAINNSSTNPLNTSTYQRRRMGYSVRCLFSN